jgi:putative pyruvate formate lyase activating enzyme
MLESCVLCPRRCKVNRLAGERGVCKLGRELVVSSASLHHGEEPPISGTGGSGTIFFTSCNLLCVFCQNHPISHTRQGTQTESKRLAENMLSLQGRGAHNINLVTPTHLVPQIMETLLIAFENGLDIPVVYNTGGYDCVETLALLDGIVDMYMPDMKYSNSEIAKKLCNAPDYPERNREAVTEMHRQVGDFKMNDLGIGTKGLLIRHLVLPNGCAGTRSIMKFIAENISQETYVSLMSQYFPDYRAHEFTRINRRVTSHEYAEAQAAMQEFGLHRGWFQNLSIDESVFNIRRFLNDHS